VKRPARVYNIHEKFEENLKDYTRYSHDWKQKYNDSGAEIVTFDHINGLKNQRIFDFKQGVSEFGKAFFGGGFSYMFADAVWEGVKEIDIVGMDLLGAEYTYQALYLKRNLEVVRARGIEVYLPNEERLKLDRIVDFSTVGGVSLMYGERGFCKHVEVVNCEADVSVKL
jgi:hypothetical protein